MLYRLKKNRSVVSVIITCKYIKYNLKSGRSTCSQVNPVLFLTTRGRHSYTFLLETVRNILATTNLKKD